MLVSSGSSHGSRSRVDHHDQLSHHHHHQQQQQQDSLQMKQNDKFFSRLMSKETSMANSSSRVYYRGASGSVPFTWESRPGTPKHTSNDTTLPPLTPPPSYLSGSGSKSKNNSSFAKNMNRSKFLTTINVFPRLVVKKKRKKNHVSPSSSSWSSSTSSSLSSSSTSSSSSSTLSLSSSSCYSFSSCTTSRLHNNNNNNVHYHDDDDDDPHHHQHDQNKYSSSSSPMCFGVKARSFNGSSRGSYSMVKMKNAMLSIVGHGSSGHQGNH
ncbi:hypothetical protein ACOSP7_032339 [Xanthoceras sorbifolium]